MFLRIYFYMLKKLSHKAWLVGWNMFFPLVLATAFYFGLGNMIKDDPNSFSVINVGYVYKQDSSYFKTVLETLSKDSQKNQKLLSLAEFTSREEAYKSMEKGDIDGIYIDNGGKIETIVPSNGMASTTLNQIVREYENTQILIKNIAKDHPDKLDQAISRIWK